MPEVCEAYAIASKPAELVPTISRQIADLIKMEEFDDGDTILHLEDGRAILRADPFGILIRVEAESPLLSCGIKSVVTLILRRSSRNFSLPLQWRQGNRERFSGVSQQIISGKQGSTRE